jgi:hypothetical protein
MNQRQRAFVMIWWNAHGEPRQSAPMDEATAKIALAGMNPEQSAFLHLVYINP